MPLLNYTTQIDSLKTVGEIQSVLAKHGANNVGVDFDSGQPVAVTFGIEFGGNYLAYRLPSSHQGVLKVISKDSKVPRRLKTDEQARRVAWRITKDWVEAQLAVVEAGVASLPEVFLPYAVMEDGRTLFHVIQERGMAQLTGGSSAAQNGHVLPGR